MYHIAELENWAQWVQGLVIEAGLHVGGIYLLHQVAPTGAEGIDGGSMPAGRAPTMPRSSGDPSRALEMPLP